MRMNKIERIKELAGLLNDASRAYYQEDIEEAMSLLQHWGDVARRYERPEMAQMISDRMKEYLALYYN